MDWKEIKNDFYKEDAVIPLDEGVVDFSPKRMKKVVNGNFKSYDEYLDIQRKSGKFLRHDFERCYYDSIESFFKGRVERINYKNKTILFQRIMVSGTYDDGTCFDGKEDHVWVKFNKPGKFSEHSCYSFDAQVYRYMKHGKNGKLIDYGLRNLSHIEKIASYEVPTDEELKEQSLKQAIHDALGDTYGEPGVESEEVNAAYEALKKFKEQSTETERLLAYDRALKDFLHMYDEK